MIRALAAALLATAVAVGCHPAPRSVETRVPSASASPRVEDGVAEATLRHIVTQLGELELRRAEMQANYTPSSPELRQVQRATDLLWTYARELRGRDAEAIVVPELLRVIDDRLGALAVRQRLSLIDYTPESAEIRALTQMVESLKTRRAELVKMAAR